MYLMKLVDLVIILEAVLAVVDLYISSSHQFTLDSLVISLLKTICKQVWEDVVLPHMFEPDGVLMIRLPVPLEIGMVSILAKKTMLIW